MQLADFDYELPEAQIAQTPAERRDGSRLLLVPRSGGGLEHKRFSDFSALLRPGDVLVTNDTRVIPARLFGRKDTGGKTEVLLDRPLSEAQAEGGQGATVQEWACLVRASKPLRDGARVDLPGGAWARCLGHTPENAYRLALSLPEDLHAYLDRYGHIPLPAYIRRDEGEGEQQGQADRDRYQTVYARNPGAVAAPTAGLHFTPAILDAIRAAGVEVVSITLHVGPGTFLPVRVEDVELHRMHHERYELPQASVQAIERVRTAKGRVVAVGTTVVRALEGAVAGQRLRPGSGTTDLFIRPGFRFQVVDALLTNFHLPRSTLLMLVCAFAGRDHVLGAYRQAVAAGYRFYSYGDAMFLS